MAISNWYIEFGGVIKGYFKRKIYLKIDHDYQSKFNQFLKETHNKDSYYTIYKYETDDYEECNVIAPLYFDIDVSIKDDRSFNYAVADTLMVVSTLMLEFGIPLDLIQIYFSGSKGFHVLVDSDVLGIKPSKSLNDDYKVIAQRMKNYTLHDSVDTSIYDRKRLFRIPNSINSKTGLYKVPLTIDELRGVTLEEMKDIASAPRELSTVKPRLVESAMNKYRRIILANRMKNHKKKHPRSVISFQKKKPLPCVVRILKEGVSEGGRNNTCTAVSSALAQSGYDKDEIQDMMIGWNQLNDPPLPESEVIRTVQSAYSLAEAGKGYGCTFFKDNGYCVGETCNIFNREAK